MDAEGYVGRDVGSSFVELCVGLHSCWKSLSTCKSRHAFLQGRAVEPIHDVYDLCDMLKN